MECRVSTEKKPNTLFVTMDNTIDVSKETTKPGAVSDTKKLDSIISTDAENGGHGEKLTVDWDGPEDTDNPINWSSGQKWTVISLISAICFVMYLLNEIIMLTNTLTNLTAPSHRQSLLQAFR